MHDPLRHRDDQPRGHDGPFVESRGLLGSIFGRGDRQVQQSPPQQQVTSGPLATRAPTISTPPTPSRPEPKFWDMKAERPPRETRQLPWVFRNFRLVMVAAFVLFGFGSSVLGSVFDGASRGTSAPTPSFETPRPSPINRQGSYRLRVDSIDGEWVRMTDASGETHRWKATDPAVRKVLFRHVGVEAMMYWRLERGITTIVGIVGPEGSVPPGSTPAADSTTLSPT